MNHVKLMVDWNFGQSYVDALNEIGVVKAQRITDYGFTNRATDADLVRGTQAHECILLTRDKSTINHNIYKPCSHGGIIVIRKSRPFADEVKAYIEAFCQSGKRALAVGHVTYLSDKQAEIHTHKGIEYVEI